MALEITGAPLEFDAFINTDGLTAGFVTVQENLNSLLSNVEKFGGGSDTAINKLIQKFKELEAAQQELKKQGETITDPIGKKANVDAIQAITDQLKAMAVQIKAMPELPEIAAKISLADMPHLDIAADLAAGLAEMEAFTNKVKELGLETKEIEDGTATLIKLFKQLADQETKARSPLLDEKQIKAANLGLKETQASIINVRKNLENLVAARQFEVFPPDEPEKVEKVIKSTARLKALYEQLITLQIAGKTGTPEYAKIADEADNLSDSISNVKQSIKNIDTGGISALKEGVGGLVGGFEAASGAIALFGADSEEAQKATQAVIGAMGVLNGLEQISALLSKDSQVNFYLKGLAAKFAAKGTQEVATATAELAAADAAALAAEAAQAAALAAQAGATEAVVLATGEQAVVTALAATAAEGATVAQWSLNAAMLANPLGALLAALAGIVAIYEVYAHTIGKTTDAEKAAQADRENSLEISKRSVETIAKEESNLRTLLVTLKSEHTTRQQKDAALEKISAAYPEYLGQLTKENALTAEGAALIEKQIGLIKLKARAAAAESVYADKLKAQAVVQAELDEVLATGQTTLGQRLKTIGEEGDRTGITIDRTGAVVRHLQKQIEEMGVGSESAFNQVTKSTNDLADGFSSDNDKFNVLFGNLQRLQGALPGYLDNIASFTVATQKALKPLDFGAPKAAFDKAGYDADYQAAKANAERKIETAKHGSDREKEVAALALAQIEKDYVKFDLSKANLTQTQLAEQQKLEDQYNDQRLTNNENANARQLKANSDAAQARLAQLEGEGKQETQAYFDAKLVAIKTAAAAEINGARFNSQEIKKIKADENLAIANAEIEFAGKKLNKERDIIETRLTLVKKGSAEELTLFLARIDNQQKQDLNVLNQTQAQKRKIEVQAAKEAQELIKKTASENFKAEINTTQARLNAELSTATPGTQNELEIKMALSHQQQILDLQNLADDKSITNAELKNAKFLEITAKGFADRLALTREFYAHELQEQFDAIDSGSARAIEANKRIIADPAAGANKKFDAQKANINQELKDTEQKISRAESQQRVLGQDTEALGKTLDALRVKRDSLKNDVKAADQQKNIDDIQKYTQWAGAAADSFHKLAADLAPINKGLSGILNTLGDIANTAQTAGSFVTSFLSGDVVGAIASGTQLLGQFVDEIFGDKARLAKIAEEQAAAQQRSFFGQIDYNIELRKTELIQVAINKLTLQGITDKKVLIGQQIEANKLAADALLKQIQGEQFVSGSHKEKGSGNPIFGLVGVLFGGKSKLVEDFGNLTGKTFEDLEKLAAEGKLTEKAKIIFDQMKQVRGEMDALLAAEAQAKAAADEIFTGTTASSIVDTIADGFSNGLRSVEDFASKTEDLVRGALLSALKTQALEAPIKKIYEQFAADAESGGGLDATEVATFTASINKTITDSAKFAEEIQKATGISLSAAQGTANSLQGSIKANLTEQTGSVLAGSINGMRLTASSQLSVANRSLEVYNKIQVNTFETAGNTADLFKLVKTLVSGDRLKVA